MKLAAFARRSAMVCAPVFLAGMAHGQAINDGNFNALAVGDLPDCATPNGAWQFPTNYPALAACEVLTTDFSTVATSSFDPSASGNSLRLNINDAVNNQHMCNILPAVIPSVTGQIVRVQFRVWVGQTGGGGSFYVGADMGGGGLSNATDRGPQIAWYEDGTFQSRDSVASTTWIPSYPRGVWQNVRLDVHLDTAKYDLYWSQGAAPVALLASNVGFRAATPPTMIDRFSVAHFGGTIGLQVSNSYLDDVTITLVGGACYANCDGSTIAPILNVNDFICFQTKYAAADSYANCDGSTIPPVLNVNDFICFQTKYAAGCP